MGAISQLKSTWTWLVPRHLCAPCVDHGKSRKCGWALEQDSEHIYFGSRTLHDAVH
jgi:hypothetical protein